MTERGRSRLGIVSLAGGGALLVACNALLDNEPRRLAADPAEAGAAGEAGDGGAGRGGGAAGESAGHAGAAARAGESGEGGGGQAGAGAAGEGGGAGCTGECVPGMQTTREAPCGDCGTQSASATCSDECRWIWEDVGPCMSTAECHPTDVHRQDASCACGGTKTQQKICGSDCRWGPPSDTSSCNLECCTSVRYCDTPDEIAPASRGTWCKQDTAGCTRAEVDADCAVSVSQLGCVIHPELFIEYL